MKKILLMAAFLIGFQVVSKAETTVATFVADGAKYQLYQDFLIISDFERTKGIKFDEVNIFMEHYRIYFSNPLDRLSFLKDKNNKYTLVGKIDGKDIIIKNLEKL